MHPLHGLPHYLHPYARYSYPYAHNSYPYALLFVAFIRTRTRIIRTLMRRLSAGGHQLRGVLLDERRRHAAALERGGREDPADELNVRRHADHLAAHRALSMQHCMRRRKHTRAMQHATAYARKRASAFQAMQHPTEPHVRAACDARAKCDDAPGQLQMGAGRAGAAPHTG